MGSQLKRQKRRAHKSRKTIWLWGPTPCVLSWHWQCGVLPIASTLAVLASTFSASHNYDHCASYSSIGRSATRNLTLASKAPLFKIHCSLCTFYSSYSSVSALTRELLPRKARTSNIATKTITTNAATPIPAIAPGASESSVEVLAESETGEAA